MMRTATCGDLSSKNVDKEVTLAGWVDTRRDHGNLIFIDLRDRWGITQVVFNPEKNADLHRLAETVRSEFVLQVKGRVSNRPQGTVNKKIPTGEVEVLADSLVILNASPTPPFEIGEMNVGEDIRLKYRYLDLRRRVMLENLSFRYRVSKIARDYLDKQAFIEIETPYLTRSTPEGARDYLVPSRVHTGSFYALPQSPQLFKQLLMVGGYDRYFQLARCFRDEDLRSDRQPEHTQIDIEMSFVEEEDVMNLVEGMVADCVEKAKGLKFARPFKHLSYEEALSRFGSDKPDLRFDMELVDLTEIFAESGFKVFDSVIKSGGKVRGICLRPPQGVEYSRKDFDDLTAWIQDYGAKGLAWFKVKGPDSVESPIQKFFVPDRMAKVIGSLQAQAGDILFMVASTPQISAVALGALRVKLAHRHGLMDLDRFEVLWITDFPLFEWDEDGGRYHALHHPFTSPMEKDIPLLEKDPAAVRARAYDLVLNGVEIGGGSIRIHRRDVQDKVFRALGIGADEARDKFGFLLDALSYGAPPHGGLAMGLDRFVALLLGLDSIREVIAFPKTQKGTCLMTEAPSEVHPDQLKELGLHVKSLDRV
ncbi:MAG: aspartate--tRNA ligase [Candidatus Omnitrophota bacterium]|nr:aspartate--tRNA ligase [Candidatus Omnitrophota bacterium]